MYTASYIGYSSCLEQNPRFSFDEGSGDFVFWKVCNETIYFYSVYGLLCLFKRLLQEIQKAPLPAREWIGIKNGKMPRIREKYLINMGIPTWNVAKYIKLLRDIW